VSYISDKSILAMKVNLLQTPKRIVHKIARASPLKIQQTSNRRIFYYSIFSKSNLKISPGGNFLENLSLINQALK